VSGFIVPPEVVESRCDAVVRMTKQGYSTRQIATVLGMTERSVTRYRKRAGITQGKPGVPPTAEQLELAAQLFEDGCSIAEVARTLGFSTSTIARYFPGRGWSPAETHAYIATLRRCRVRMKQHEGVFIK
jgi:DNA-binding CsgD family transcriptional regulator